MGEVVLVGTPAIALRLSRSARARRFSLRVSRHDGSVVLTVPARAGTAAALDFARAHEGWLRATLAALPPRQSVAPGASLPVEGAVRALVAAPVRAPRLDGNRLLVPDRPGATGPRVAAFLKALARERLAAACDRHGAALGRMPAALALRDPRGRWGSCSAAGRVMFSWRLAMAPPAVLDYVAAHEVAHLVEMNHAPAFWAVVAGLVPDHSRHRAWLREHGGGLLAHDFG